MVGIKARNLAGLEAYVNDISKPSSPNYRHFLTPADIKSRFGPTSADLSAVVNYLRSKGLRITMTSRNGTAVLAHGTLSQMQTAFSTTIKQVQGRDFSGQLVAYRCNTTVLKVPSSLAGKVTEISGIDRYPRIKKRANTQTLTPHLAHVLYDTQPAIDAGFLGSGRTMAVTNFDGYRLSNVPIFYATYGLPTPPGGVGSNITVIPVGTPAGPGNPGVEGDLDIQMELGMAPFAQLLIYDSQDPEATIAQEASDNAADVLSESYGIGYDLTGANQAHVQHSIMSAQGQTYMVASGDNGTDINVGGIQDYNSYEPEEMSVGGTVATVDSVTGVRVTEDGWDGSGGGWGTAGASFNVLPPFQVAAGFSSGNNHRLTPDIGLQAGGPGAVDIIFGGGVITVDGTSVASPLCCGCLALMEGRLADNGFTSRLGRICDTIYPLGPDSSCFVDILTGSTGQLPDGSSATGHAGWDFVTGWGAPDFEGLYQAITSGGSTGTDVPPFDANTVIGTFNDGDATSLATTDGVYYQVDSDTFPQFGVAAGLDGFFTVPAGTNKISVKVQAQGGSDGGANMVWAFNWNTGAFDLIGDSALSTFEGDPSTIVIRSNVSNYISPTNQVTIRLRGHYPNRPIGGGFPGSFTYQVDLFELVVR